MIIGGIYRKKLFSYDTPYSQKLQAHNNYSYLVNKQREGKMIMIMKMNLYYASINTKFLLAHDNV